MPAAHKIPAIPPYILGGIIESMRIAGGGRSPRITAISPSGAIRVIGR